VSVLFRNKEESKLKKLAVQTDSFERVRLTSLMKFYHLSTLFEAFIVY